MTAMSCLEMEHACRSLLSKFHHRCVLLWCCIVSGLCFEKGSLPFVGLDYQRLGHLPSRLRTFLNWMSPQSGLNSSTSHHRWAMPPLVAGLGLRYVGALHQAMSVCSCASPTAVNTCLLSGIQSPRRCNLAANGRAGHGSCSAIG